MANTCGEKELRTDWNDPDNLGEQIALVAERSFVPARNKAGI
jgi:hypothetical protein